MHLERGVQLGSKGANQFSIFGVSDEELEGPSLPCMSSVFLGPSNVIPKFQLTTLELSLAHILGFDDYHSQRASASRWLATGVLSEWTSPTVRNDSIQF